MNFNPVTIGSQTIGKASKPSPSWSSLISYNFLCYFIDATSDSFQQCVLHERCININRAVDSAGCLLTYEYSTRTLVLNQWITNVAGTSFQAPRNYQFALHNLYEYIRTET
jgi:hypothetical protein